MAHLRAENDYGQQELSSLVRLTLGSAFEVSQHVLRAMYLPSTLYLPVDLRADSFPYFVSIRMTGCIRACRMGCARRCTTNTSAISRKRMIKFLTAKVTFSITHGPSRASLTRSDCSSVHLNRIHWKTIHSLVCATFAEDPLSQASHCRRAA